MAPGSMQQGQPFEPSRPPTSTRTDTGILMLLRGVALGLLLFASIAAGLLRVVESPAKRNPNQAKQDPSFYPRPVRVLLGSDLNRVRFQSDTALMVLDSEGRIVANVRPGVRDQCTADRRGLMIRNEPVASPVRVESADGASIFAALYRNGTWTEPIEYPGVLRFEGDGAGRFTLINEVDVEPYVACVTANEVWPGFHEVTMRAQAIVARTYVLYQMKRRKADSFDVRATQGSQVYRGIRRDSTGIDATRATELTRGLVLTWFDGTQDRVFCAYYSAACGGMSQSAAIFGVESDIEPLSGGVRCDYCRIAPGETYRWGPVQLKLDEVYDRLVSRFPELQALSGLASVEVSDTTPDGRAVTIRLKGRSGDTDEILAERFRLALGASEIRSTSFRLRRKGLSIVFEDGKGFGHGLGLCQWGAEGQARQGISTSTILRHYYHGARITRAY